MKTHTRLSITTSELLHAKKFLSLTALTSGQHSTTTQKQVYLEQGILPPSLAKIPNSTESIEAQIETISSQITDDNIEKFYSRLIKKRPLTFVGSDDFCLLRDGKTQSFGCPGDINPREYVVYTEMEFGAMLQVASPTIFINDGNRYNQGGSTGDNHETVGRIAALVGARLEIDDGMEALHCVCGVLERAEQRHALQIENGERTADFGRIKGVTKEFVDGYKYIWSEFYKQASDVVEDGLYISKLEYRLYISYKKFFADAVANSTFAKKAYIRVVGLGDGVWSNGNTYVIRRAIGNAVRRVFDELTTEEKRKIAVIEFSQYQHKEYALAFGLKSESELLDDVEVISSEEAFFAHKLPDRYNDCQLCVNFAWDGGSYVGNEYWNGELSASGDPAAACCSSITTSMNPDRNPEFLENLCIV